VAFFLPQVQIPSNIISGIHSVARQISSNPSVNFKSGTYVNYFFCLRAKDLLLSDRYKMTGS